MQHIPKQSHCVKYPALELLCNNLCGPRTKNFGGPALHDRTPQCTGSCLGGKRRPVAHYGFVTNVPRWSTQSNEAGLVMFLWRSSSIDIRCIPRFWSFRFWVYGKQRAVYTRDYPHTCCCCTVLWAKWQALSGSRWRCAIDHHVSIACLP